MTKLTQGNKALRDKNYQQAIAFYIEALIANPELSKAIVPNVAMAQQKFTLSREENKGKQNVAVCGWALSGNVERICTLAELYKTFAEVEIIGALLPKLGTQVSKPIGDIPVHSFVVDDESLFLEQALKLVLAHPYDVVHLSQPKMPNIFFGLLYKLIWNAKVLVDIDAKEGSATSVDDYIEANGCLPKLKNLVGKDWNQLALGLVYEFDAITTTDIELQKTYGGEIIHHTQDEVVDNISFESLININNRISQELIFLLSLSHLFQYLFYLTDTKEYYNSYFLKIGNLINPNYRVNLGKKNLKKIPFKHSQENIYSKNHAIESSLKYSTKKTMPTKPLLFIGHDGIQAGSEVVLLEIIKWFYIHTRRRLKVLLLDKGPMADQYAHYADVYILNNCSINNVNKLCNYLNEDFEIIYVNTVVSGNIFKLLKEKGIVISAKIITHIHEMEMMLNLYSDAMKILIEKTDHWISASPTSTKTLIEKYEIPITSITTVSAFIQPIVDINNHQNKLRVQSRKKLNINNDLFVIVGCGTVCWRKGSDLFIKVARYIKKHTTKPCEFIWFGNGPDKKSLVSGLSYEEKKYIKFLGKKLDSNKLVSIADIFLLSSREDPFPLVVLESAQHEIPTVCFAPATGITEFIRDDAGVAITNINTIEAAKSILQLMKNPIKIKQLGRKAKSRLFSTYTSEKQNIKIFTAIM